MFDEDYGWDDLDEELFDNPVFVDTSKDFKDDCGDACKL